MDNLEKPVFSDCEESEMVSLGIKRIVDNLDSLDNVNTSKERLRQMLLQYRHRSSSEASTVSHNCSSDEEIPEANRFDEGSKKGIQKEIIEANIDSGVQSAIDESEAKKELHKESGDDIISGPNKEVQATVSEMPESNLIDDVHYTEDDASSSDSIEEIVHCSSKNLVQNVKLESCASVELIGNDEIPKSLPSGELAIAGGSANPSLSPPLSFGSVQLLLNRKSIKETNKFGRKVNNSSSSSWTSSEFGSGIFESDCNDHQMEEQCSDDVLHFLDVRIDHRRKQLKMKNRNSHSSLKENKLLRKLLTTKVNYLKMMVHVEKKRLKTLKKIQAFNQSCSVSE